MVGSPAQLVERLGEFAAIGATRVHLRLIDLADLDHLELDRRRGAPPTGRTAMTTRRRPELGPVGQEIVYENDRVRVWHIRLEPGERQPLHRHDHPYLVVAIQGAKNVVQTVDGTRIDADEPTGGVVYRDPGAVHMLTNVGDTTYLARLVELK